MNKIIVKQIHNGQYVAKIKEAHIGIGNTKAKALINLLKSLELKEKEAERAVKKISDIADKVEKMVETALIYNR